MTLTEEVSYEDLNEQLKANESISNLSNSAFYRIATFIAGCVSLPAGVTLYVFNEMLIANKSALKALMKKMDEGSEIKIISTYDFMGYGTGGSSYPTYKLSSQTYRIS